MWKLVSSRKLLGPPIILEFIPMASVSLNWIHFCRGFLVAYSVTSKVQKALMCPLRSLSFSQLGAS